MPWLEGWSNRIKLTLDGSKIDEDLTDFPLMINVASGTGRTNNDITDVFDELSELTKKDYTTWNPDDTHANMILSNGNLTATSNSTTNKSTRGIQDVSSGKWYWEVSITVGATHHQIGIGKSTVALNNWIGHDLNGYAYSAEGGKWNNNSSSSYGDAFGVGDIVGVALDLDNGKIWWSKNGVWQASGVPASGTNPAFSGLSGTFFPMYANYYSGYQAIANFGASSFSYSPPNGFNSGLYEYTYQDYEKRIMVTTNNGTTPCYVEIEYWNWEDEQAWLWTKVPTITSGTNINLYLYYDKNQPDNTTYVENTGTYPATEVWDDNFKAVYHFSESSGQLIDSTSNNFNCTVNGGTTRNHDSPVGYAYNFDGSGDYAETLSNIGISSDDVRTSQVVIKANSTSQSQWAYYLGWGGTNTLIDWNMNHFNATGRWGTSLWGVAYDYDSSVDIDTDNWHINTFRYDGSNVSSFIDLTEFGVNAHTPNTSDTHLFIGGGHYGGRDFNCKISEVRISDINRADAWLKADYYSVHDDLITFSDPDKSGPPVLSFSGYTYEVGLPVSRIVRAYRRDTGELVDETTSDSSGYYYLNTTISGEHSLVCLDDVGGNDYNDLIIGCATASGIGG